MSAIIELSANFDAAVSAHSFDVFSEEDRHEMRYDDAGWICESCGAVDERSVERLVRFEDHDADGAFMDEIEYRVCQCCAKKTDAQVRAGAQTMCAKAAHASFSRERSIVERYRAMKLQRPELDWSYIACQVRQRGIDLGSWFYE